MVEVVVVVVVGSSAGITKKSGYLQGYPATLYKQRQHYPHPEAVISLAVLAGARATKITQTLP